MHAYVVCVLVLYVFTIKYYAKKRVKKPYSYKLPNRNIEFYLLKFTPRN